MEHCGKQHEQDTYVKNYLKLFFTKKWTNKSKNPTWHSIRLEFTQGRLATQPLLKALDILKTAASAATGQRLIQELQQLILFINLVKNCSFT